MVIVGAAHRAGTAPRSRENAKGYIRGFDVRTGKRRWIFHTIPQPGEFGNETWLQDSWAYTGHTGVWTQMTVDEELGIAYLPVEIPTGDYFGGHRPATTCSPESGRPRPADGQAPLAFPVVHHPIWDYDVPCAPILPTHGRRPENQAVAQPTKQGFLYVFDPRPASPSGRSKSGPSKGGGATEW